MNKIPLTAVKAGKHFNLFREEILGDIQLSRTCICIKINNHTYNLHDGKTIEDSRKILKLLKAYGKLQIKDYQA